MKSFSIIFRNTCIALLLVVIAIGCSMDTYTCSTYSGHHSNFHAKYKHRKI